MALVTILSVNLWMSPFESLSQTCFQGYTVNIPRHPWIYASCSKLDKIFSHVTGVICNRYPCITRAAIDDLWSNRAQYTIDHLSMLLVTFCSYATRGLNSGISGTAK